MDNMVARWVLVDTKTGQQPGPPVRFTDVQEAETYRRFAYAGNPRFAVKKIEVALAIDPGEQQVW